MWKLIFRNTIWFVNPNNQFQLVRTISNFKVRLIRIVFIHGDLLHGPVLLYESNLLHIYIYLVTRCSLYVKFHQKIFWTHKENFFEFTIVQRVLRNTCPSLRIERIIFYSWVKFSCLTGYNMYICANINLPTLCTSSYSMCI